MADKKWLLDQLNGLMQLNKDSNDLISSSQNSSLPDIGQWIQDAKTQIERNDGLIGIIKEQLLRDYALELHLEELELLNSIE